ncbi:hypothetical protein HZB07_05675 [Candidatus Saganbacteria bacterium]|nr:hypothetical protein [Candidatus Saganbacteria bacterium]
MKSQQQEKLKKLLGAKVLVDYKDYSWLINNYENLLEDMNILQSKELKKAELDIAKGRLHHLEEIKRALKV